MKILRISLRNIASLAGEHTVDFTKAPLANAGLFAISGPTGSGKSTLLDALCLALYDQTPRMSVVVGAASVEDAGKEVQQSDVRNLLRRGCGEGYAEVAFVGVDGLTYTACWVARRAQAKADRALQNSQHSLFKTNAPYGTERELATDGTRTEVKREIAAKVGLSFDQFRRAVLLAQGDFATFLKAKDTERAEILQALTGTERFEKISIAVYELHKKEEALVEARRSPSRRKPVPRRTRNCGRRSLSNLNSINSWPDGKNSWNGLVSRRITAGSWEMRPHRCASCLRWLKQTSPGRGSCTGSARLQSRPGRSVRRKDRLKPRWQT